MLSLEEARERILALIKPLSTESVALAAAAGRGLAEEIISPIALPLFPNSAMDGYAVRSEDLAGATREAPVPLRLAGQVAAGEIFAGEVPQQGCIRIFTGSALPAGAGAVGMQGDTRIGPVGAGGFSQ